MRGFLLLMLVLFAMPLAVHAAQPLPYVFASRGADLHQKPDAASPVIARLERLTEVKILRKRKGWLRVRAANAGRKAPAGWLREGQVRKPWRPSREQKARHSVLGAFASLFGGDEPPKKTAVLGVRGLEDEGGGAQGAKDMRGLRQVESIAVSPEEVARFVREGRLNP